MRLTYWTSGGDVVGIHGRVVTLDEAGRLRRMHLDEARLRAGLGDHRACARALRMAMELRRALESGARWRRAAAVRYGAAEVCSRAANSSREFTLGGGASGTGSPRKSHSGSHPCEDW